MRDATSHTARHGALTLIATHNGGTYALNVFQVAERLPVLGIATPDRQTYRARYRLVAEMAEAGHSVAEIAEAIHAPARAVLAAVAAIVDRPQVGPTKTGRNVLPITEAQLDALAIAATHPQGIVYRGATDEGRAPRPVLVALARGGWVTLTAHEGTRASNWAYGRITDRGRAALDAAKAVSR